MGDKGKQTPYAEKQTQLQLTPQQLATVLLYEGAIADLQTRANQLHGFLKLEAEAGPLVQALQQIAKCRDELMTQWRSKIQVVQAIPNLNPINGNKPG